MAVEAATAGASAGSKSLGIVLWGVILLVIAGVAAGVSWVNSYEPLTSGSMAGFSGQAKEVETYSDVSVLILTPWEEGATFFGGFTIRNEGSRAVTVTGILQPHETGVNGEPSNGFEPVAALVAPKERFVGELSLDYEEYGEFTPFELDAGEERRVAIQYRLNACVPRGGSMGDDSVTVKFSLFGMDRETEFALPHRIVADGKYREGC